MTDTNKHKTLDEMSDAEICAMVRAQHEAWVIRPLCSAFNTWWVCDKQEPNRETVTLSGDVIRGKVFFRRSDDPYNVYTHKISFDTVDGEPDCDSIRMERIDD